MSHPLWSLEPRFLGALTLRFGALLVFSTALMAFVDVPLQGDATPWGIVSFELAGTPHRALAILLEWQSKSALGYAKLSLIIDFVYLLIYGVFFSMLAVWIGKRLDEETWSTRAAWAATLAPGFDVLENGVLLFEVVRFSSPAPYPQLALTFAGAKFVLLGVSVLYSVVGSARVVHRH
ncbi:MAG: hypothetical protein OER77_09730 [Myxococcales bacterium]|nr:hypothetical protein [Myxococcales bacterium]